MNSRLARVCEQDGSPEEIEEDSHNADVDKVARANASAVAQSASGKTGEIPSKAVAPLSGAKAVELVDLCTEDADIIDLCSDDEQED